MTPATLRAKREALQLTQEQLGEALGLTATSVYRMESGRQAITPQTKNMIALLVYRRDQPV